MHSIKLFAQLCFELRSFKMFKLLFIANATRSRSTLLRNMVEYQMVQKTPFHASERAPVPTPRIYVKFRASVQILFKRGFKKPILESCENNLPNFANFTKCKMKVTSPNGTVPRLCHQGVRFFFRPNRRSKSCRLQLPRPFRPGCCSC